MDGESRGLQWERGGFLRDDAKGSERDCQEVSEEYYSRNGQEASGDGLLLKDQNDVPAYIPPKSLPPRPPETHSGYVYEHRED